MRSIKLNISVLFLIVSLFISFRLYSQSADVTKGCIPLEVNFNTSELSRYYWEFVEGNATSTLQNPTHIFTHAGNYTIRLYEGQNGNKIGEINIKVYEDPFIDFEADTTFGCTPLTVAFTSEISLDPEINIIGYNWTFGDGESSTEQNPIHIYKVGGEFKVSLELITDIVQCNEIYSKEKYIKTEEVYINFVPNTYFICDNEGKIKFQNKSSNEPGYTYFWDFGNGKTSTEYNPDSVHFERGNFTITLEVTPPEGCVYKKKRTITIGKPIFDLKIPEIGCIHEYFDGRFNDSTVIVNDTKADSFEWYFSPVPEDWNSKRYFYKNGELALSNDLHIVYNESGIKNLFLRAYSGEGCFSDTSFTILIEDPEPQITINPRGGCDIPVTINFNTTDTTFSKYYWNYLSGSPVTLFDKYSGEYVYSYPYVDSLYWKLREAIPITLDILTKNNCKDFVQAFYIHESINASFVPDNVQGCAPLKVTFADSSKSKIPIIEWKYIYGNGDSTILYTNEDHSYTFTNPGDYFIKQIIENENGCKDTSAGVWIRVGEPIFPEYEIDKTEICLGDSVQIFFKNEDSRIDAFHIYTDDGRYNNCWKDKNKSHVFNTMPGEYPIIAVIEYNGCYVHDTSNYKITVKGAKANIGYFIDCENPNTVTFEDKSINSDKSIWTIDGDTILDKTKFNKYFDNTGDYLAKLESYEIASGCAPTIDSANFKITNIKANLEVPSKFCDSDLIDLNAEKSIDVMSGCTYGYTYYINNSQVPFKTNSSVFSTILPSDKYEIKLIVEDVNGCKDTIVKNIRSYGIHMDITLDKEIICLPSKIKVTNNTVGDTTLFWKWFDGSTEKSPEITIESTILPDHALITGYVFDALGCFQNYSKKIPLYKPESDISILPRTSICVGDELKFSAKDYNEQGSKLDFNWILEGIDSFSQKDNSVVIDSAGTYQLKYHFTEISSGCSGDSIATINVYDIPKANFYSDIDSLSPLCYPQVVVFKDTSTIYGPGYIEWVFEDVSLSNNNKKTQVIVFPKGKHKASLIAQSFSGCADTLSKYIDVVGPEGEVVSDKFSVCTGDTITFHLINAVDVNSFKWDFGDGVVISDKNPIKYAFNRVIDTTDAKIIIKSTDNCEKSIDIPLLVNEVAADFEKIDTTVFCNGYAFLRNLSVGANKFIWSTKGEINDSLNPIFIVYPTSGSYEITLKASNTINNCKDEITKTIDLEEYKTVYTLPNVFTPNNDGENDTFRPVITNEDFVGSLYFKTFKIYNRWGNIVYDNENPESGWDGKFNGVDAPAGVYGYYLNVDINGCGSIIEKGNITLIR